MTLSNIIPVTALGGGGGGGPTPGPFPFRSNSIGLTAVVEKVAPFTAIPQVRFDIQAGNGFQSDVSQVASTALTAAPSAGVISPGWLGEDFVSASFIFVFLNTAVGGVDLFIQLEFLPHIRDLYPTP